MKKEDLLEAYHVYETIIKTQVFNPIKVNEIYKKLNNIEQDVLVNQRKARHFLFNFFYYKRYLEQYPDLEQDYLNMKKAEEPINDVVVEEEPEVNEIEKISDVEKTEEILNDEQILEQIILYEQQKNLSEDVNEKRSLSQKINHLKKKLSNE